MNEHLNNPETLDEYLKSLEYADMQAYCERARKRTPNLLESETYRLTPIEHRLIGSTYIGQAFHPNFPLPLIVGKSLAEINEARNSNRELWLFHRIEAKEHITLYFKLISISEEQASSQKAQPTFEITRAAKIDQRTRIDIPSDLSESLENRFIKIQDDIKKLFAQKHGIELP